MKIQGDEGDTLNKEALYIACVSVLPSVAIKLDAVADVLGKGALRTMVEAEAFAIRDMHARLVGRN